MDVRCEKCQTEYELDEGKLKPGGVTVKCTTCGHMFRVRPTAASRAEVAAPAAPSAPMTDHRTPTPSSSGRASSVLMDTEEGERTWLIRLEDGEIKTCRELSTLQKWIVSGRVSRSCSISRTGKKWKLLGEIGELASFFGIADEARDARQPPRWGGASATREYPAPPGPDGSFGSLPSSSAAHPRTVPRRSTAEPSAPLHLDDVDGDRGGGYGNGEPRGDSDGDSPDEEDATAPASYADALAAEMERAKSGAALGAAPGGFAHTLPLGGAALATTRHGTGGGPEPGARHGGGHGAAQMKAQAPPPDLLGDMPPELSAPIPADLPIDDELSEPGPVGALPTLPPYGAGILDASPSRPATRSSGLPLAPPPSRPVPSTSASATPAGPTSGAWASRGSVGGGMRDHGPSGPTGGKAHGDGDEAAFVGGRNPRMPNIRGEFENGKFVPSPFVDDDPLLPRRSSGALWVVLFSLVVMAGAAGAVYLVMYQGDDATEAAAPTAPAEPVTPPTGTTPPVTPPVTEEPVTPPVTPPGEDKAADEAVAAAQAAILGDSPAGLASAEQTLAALSPDGPPGPVVLVARARVEAALSQQLADRAKLAASPADGKKLLGQAKVKARASRQLAEQALQAKAGDAAALVVVADARRLEGERTVEVERWLRKAQQSPAGAELTAEIDLVTAQLRVRDNRLRDARVALDKLAKATPAGDVRARFRLAWLEYLDSNADAARAGVEAVLKTQADHGGARALLEKLGDKPPVDGGDPMPPEEKGDKVADKPVGKVADKPGDKVADKPADKGDKEPTGDSFDQVLDRAQKLAENGNCNAAMPLYRKVLDLHPAAVEALTGLGHCHLDRREYASAHTRFRAALGISSRYQPAMWGIAEAYQQQGMKQEALERFEAFVSEHPNGPRADAARERIANLRREVGSTEGGSSGGTESGGTESGGTESGGQGSGTSEPGSGSEPPASGAGESESGADESAPPSGA